MAQLSAQILTPDEVHSPRPRLLLALLIALGFFCFYAGDLSRMQFTSASENVVLKAALEMRQGGPWWVPNLNGEPRVTKPPLTTWITAAAMSQRTVDELSSLNVEVRHSAHKRLALQVRWPAALSSSLMILGVFVLGSLLLGPNVGLVAMIMTGTSLLLFRYGRTATTDVQIALWVTWTNVCLVAALTGRNRWFLAGAGVFLGLAVMSKGPVAIAQSVLPAAIYLGYLRSRIVAKPLLFPAAVGGLVMLAISLPWPLSIVLRDPDVAKHWFREITRIGATGLVPDPWFDYVKLLPNLMPWAPLFVAGLCAPFIGRLRSSAVVFAWLLFVAPVVAMSFASDKPERYAMPLIGPAAILAAYIAVVLVRTRPQWRATDKLVVALQWSILSVVPAAVIAGASYALWTDIGLGFTPWIGVVVGAVSLMLAIGALLGRRTYPWGMVGATAICALMIYPLGAIAYAASGNGQSACRGLSDRIFERYDDFRAYYFDPRAHPRHIPTDLGVYLDRVVRRVADVRQIPPGPTAALVFMLQRRDEPMPICPGGELEMSALVDKQTCHVFRLTSDQ